MFENIEALIFDLDGTLIDSMGVWKEIDIEYLHSIGREFPEDLQKHLEGMCFDDVAVYMKQRFNIPDSLETIKSTWNDMAEYKYSHEIKLKPGVSSLLDFGKRKGMKLGIATSNSLNLTTLVLKANGLGDTFDYVLTGCETLKSKPDPDIYLEAARKLNVDNTKCLVFEDIVAGITAGKRAGMKVCGIDDFNSVYSRDQKKALSDYYIGSYTEIVYPD